MLDTLIMVTQIICTLQVQLYEDFAKSQAKKTVTSSLGEEPAKAPKATSHIFQVQCTYLPEGLECIK